MLGQKGSWIMTVDKNYTKFSRNPSSGWDFEKKKAFVKIFYQENIIWLSFIEIRSLDF